MRHVSAITGTGASRNNLSDSPMPRVSSKRLGTYATVVADGTHQTSTPIHHWRTNTCLTLAPSLFYAPAHSVFASSVCSQEVTACFRSASVANRMAVSCFLSISNRRELLGKRLGCLNHLCAPLGI